jgi:hypothetical protein
MRKIKFKRMLRLSLSLLLMLSLGQTSMALDLAANLKPGFPSLDASPLPSPEASPSDDDDEPETEFALNPLEEQHALACFRVDKACEANLATCNANYAGEDNSFFSWPNIKKTLAALAVGFGIRSLFH